MHVNRWIVNRWKKYRELAQPNNSLFEIIQYNAMNNRKYNTHVFLVGRLYYKNIQEVFSSSNLILNRRMEFERIPGVAP